MKKPELLEFTKRQLTGIETDKYNAKPEQLKILDKEADYYQTILKILKASEGEAVPNQSETRKVCTSCNGELPRREPWGIVICLDCL